MTKSTAQPAIRLSQRSAWSADQPIGDLMGRAIANPDLISLAAGFVDRATLPVEPVRAAFEDLIGDDWQARHALQYGATHGDRELRHLILERLQTQDGLPYEDLNPDRIVLSAGSNQMLQLIGDTLLDQGDIILCASPTYLVFLGVLQGLGARSIGVTTDQDGMIPESVEQRLTQLEQQGELSRVKAIYLVSYFDNPMGISTSAARRKAIVEIARRWSDHHQIFVIEDAAYRELRYDCDDIPSARAYDSAGDTVIHTGSFSKSFSPGLRIGWGILPESLVEPVCNQKGNIDFGSPHLNQRLMARVIRQGNYDRHIETLRSEYAVKRQAMLEAADRYLAEIDQVSWVRPDGGLYVWVTLPPTLDAGPDGPLFDTAIAEGVLYVPGHYCFPAEGPAIQANTIRLSFGVQTPDQIVAGVEALARAIKKASC